MTFFLVFNSNWASVFVKLKLETPSLKDPGSVADNSVSKLQPALAYSQFRPMHDEYQQVLHGLMLVSQLHQNKLICRSHLSCRTHTHTHTGTHTHTELLSRRPLMILSVACAFTEQSISYIFIVYQFSEYVHPPLCTKALTIYF